MALVPIVNCLGWGVNPAAAISAAESAAQTPLPIPVNANAHNAKQMFLIENVIIHSFILPILN